MGTLPVIDVRLVIEDKGKFAKRLSYMLLRPLPFDEFTVPAGFITDFGSVPALFEAIVSGEDPQLAIPSIGHDYLYREGGIGRFTRKQADEWLVNEMKKLGASIWKRNKVWLGVRVGGCFTWPSSQS